MKTNFEKLDWMRHTFNRTELKKSSLIYATMPKALSLCLYFHMKEMNFKA